MLPLLYSTENACTRSLHMHSNEARGDGRSSQEMIADSANTQRVDLAIEQNGGGAHGLLESLKKLRFFMC